MAQVAGNTLILVFLFLSLCSSKTRGELGTIFFRHIESSPYFNVSEATFSFGDDLFLRGEYKLAVHEYKREIMSSESEETRFRLALAEIKSGDYDEGQKELENLLVCEDPDLKGRAQRMLGFLKLRKGEILSGRFEFVDLRNRAENPLEKAELSYWIGWSYLLEYDFASAEKEFNAVAEEKSPENKFFISSYIIAREIRMNTAGFDHRSPVLARWLSVILPGAGQAYVGNYSQAAISFILNATFGYLTISSLLAKRYFQSIAYFYFLFARYYFGSGDNAYKMALEFNELQKADFVKQLIETHLVWNENQ